MPNRIRAASHDARAKAAHCLPSAAPTLGRDLFALALVSLVAGELARTIAWAVLR